MAADENKPEPCGAGGIAERLRNALFGSRKQAGKDSVAGVHAERGYSYLIEFRCRGTLAYSAKTDNLGERITIGRSPENDWIIPAEDRSSGDFRGQLTLTSKDVSLTAIKGGKFRYKGRETSGKKLLPGDRVSIGDCELTVSHAESSADRPCDVHRLEYLNGPLAGSMARLEHSLIKIGSAKDNDIVIDDDVVSAHHAELKISDDGQTWLRDTGSQNGTYVNGAKMGRTERMLMDSDIISIAFYDLRFLDMNVIHTRTNAAKKILAVFATVVLTFMVFGIFYALTPTSESVIGEYDEYLKNDDFDGARGMLSKLPYSREFKKFADEYPEYKESLARYETVYRVFGKFKEYLKNSEWAKATSCIGQLHLESQSDWNWNGAGVSEYMKEAGEAKSHLIQMYALSNLLSDTDLPAENMKSELSKIEKTPYVKADFGKGAPEYLRPLCAAISQKVDELRANVANLEKLDKLLKGINWEDADIQKLLSQIDGIKRDSMGGVRMKAQHAEELIKKMRGNIESVRSNQEKFYNLRFGELDRQIDFISPDECMNYDSISKLRTEIISRNSQILKGTDAIKYIISNISEYGIDAGVPEVAKAFNSRQTWDGLLSFKSLKSQPAEVAEGGYADEYDKLLGFKYFYDIISQIPTLSTNIFSTDLLLPEQHRPDCIELSDTYKAAEEAFAWFSMPENKWMLRGKISGLRGKIADVLKTRENLLNMLNEIVRENPNGRKYFVSKAAYFYFAPPGSVSKDDIDEFAKKWREFRRLQYSAWEKYNPIDADKIKDVKERILSNGIPGDPIVNRVWRH